MELVLITVYQASAPSFFVEKSSNMEKQQIQIGGFDGVERFSENYVNAIEYRNVS